MFETFAKIPALKRHCVDVHWACQSLVIVSLARIVSHRLHQTTQKHIRYLPSSDQTKRNGLGLDQQYSISGERRCWWKKARPPRLVCCLRSARDQLWQFNKYETPLLSVIQLSCNWGSSSGVHSVTYLHHVLSLSPVDWGSPRANWLDGCQDLRLPLGIQYYELTVT